MTGRYFVDSKVWLYLFTEDDAGKRDGGDTFFRERTGADALCVSWQIVNEVWGNLLRKGKSDEVARGMVEHILRSCELVDFSLDLLLRAHDLRSRHAVSFWDSLVVAAALTADCDCLVSEDMQDGKRFDGLLVRNIFTRDGR